MNIAIVGTGYVGLVSGTCFADTGANVTCVDVDTQKIERLKNGDIPIYEPGLDELVRKNVAAGRLKFTTDLASVLDDVEIVFSAVGTPPDEDGSADLKYYCSCWNGQEGQEDHRRRAAEAWRQHRVRCGIEPRVPQRGKCHQGLHVARSRGSGCGE